jgi:CHAP domain
MEHSRRQLISALALGASSTLLRAGDSVCLNYQSSGNPYLCYAPTGNCVWWAWKEAKDNWGVALPPWGNASKWAASAKSAGYTVSPTPAVGTIAVNTKVANGDGHVTWVTALLTGARISVTEMLYGTNVQGERANTYADGYFDGGYIYAPVPVVTSVYPSMRTSSPYPQIFTVSGSRFTTNSLTVAVTSPYGARTNLSGSQISNLSTSSFSIKVLATVSGLWSFVVIDSSGLQSPPFWIYII